MRREKDKLAPLLEVLEEEEEVWREVEANMVLMRGMFQLEDQLEDNQEGALEEEAHHRVGVVGL